MTISLKKIVSGIVGIGVTNIVDDVVDAVTPDDLTLPAKLLRKVGAWAIGAAVGVFVEEKIDKTMDEVMAIAGNVKEVIESDEKETSEADDEDCSGEAGSEAK